VGLHRTREGGGKCGRGGGDDFHDRRCSRKKMVRGGKGKDAVALFARSDSGKKKSSAGAGYPPVLLRRRGGSEKGRKREHPGRAQSLDAGQEKGKGEKGVTEKKKEYNLTLATTVCRFSLLGYARRREGGGEKMHEYDDAFERGRYPLVSGFR